MWWFIGFVVGIAYAFVMFFLGTKFDNETYYSGITLSTAQCMVFIFVTLIWPITLFIPKLRKPEFYANLKIKRKKK